MEIQSIFYTLTCDCTDPSGPGLWRGGCLEARDEEQILEYGGEWDGKVCIGDGTLLLGGKWLGDGYGGRGRLDGEGIVRRKPEGCKKKTIGNLSCI